MGVQTGSPIEDERGVDMSRIEHELTLTVPERVREMVHAANALMAGREHARRVSRPEE